MKSAGIGSTLIIDDGNGTETLHVVDPKQMIRMHRDARTWHQADVALHVTFLLFAIGTKDVFLILAFGGLALFSLTGWLGRHYLQRRYYPSVSTERPTFLKTLDRIRFAKQTSSGVDVSEWQGTVPHRYLDGKVK